MILWWRERPDFHGVVLELCLFIRGTVAKAARMSPSSKKYIACTPVLCQFLNASVQRSVAASILETKGDKVGRKQTRFFLSFSGTALPQQHRDNTFNNYFIFVVVFIGHWLTQFLCKNNSFQIVFVLFSTCSWPLLSHTGISWFVFWVFREGCEKALASVRTERFGWNILWQGFLLHYNNRKRGPLAKTCCATGGVTVKTKRGLK